MKNNHNDYLEYHHYCQVSQNTCYACECLALLWIQQLNIILQKYEMFLLDYLHPSKACRAAVRSYSTAHAFSTNFPYDNA